MVSFLMKKKKTVIHKNEKKTSMHINVVSPLLFTYGNGVTFLLQIYFPN